MAEFDNEAASLDLFQEIFHPKSSRDGTADKSSIINDVDLNVNKRSHNSNFLKSSILSKNIDNVAPIHSDVVGFIEENSSNGALSNVRLNSIEHLKNVTDSVEDNSKCFADNKSDCLDYEYHVNDDKDNVDAENQFDEKNGGKQKKGISFPKDTFISGYFEPPDPWKNAPSWTTDELVSAYRKSCELHGTKPIAKLVQQLQALQSPGMQAEVLSLKGEKLDQKQCECLEEILRRVQFKLVDLEACHLDDECSVALFDMIEYYESACQLNISFNKNIQARGWQACSRLVRRTPNLTYLDMKSCDLNDRFMPIFGRALKLGCHLTVLHMESMNLSGRPLVILVAALKMNDTLQELFLAENKLMPTDGVQMGNLLRYNRKLSLLDLRNNHLQDVGTNHVCEGLMEQAKSPGLRTLVLWNNSINYQAMPALGRALASSENLETLNIGHNALTNEGIHLLKDGLLKTNSLLRLGLQGTRITDEGAVALAEYIADSTVLLRIDLRDNDIKTGGLMALSHAMRVNTSVTRIDLDKDPKKESSMKDYAEQQSHLLRDILTFQQRNIQLVLKKEEQEKALLESKAEAASKVTKKELEDEQAPGMLPANASTESFTLFDNGKEEMFIKDAKQEKDRKDAENARAKNNGDKLEESPILIEGSDNEAEVDSVLPKEETKPQNRPSVLFPYQGLPPQASLDSPMLTSNGNPLVSMVSQSFPSPQLDSQHIHPHKCLLNLNVDSAPGEMILSPQYFPKQIARKIFSVSRVQEDPSCSQQLASDPSHTLSAAFDPLNVVPISLVPISSSSLLPSTSSSALASQYTHGGSYPSSDSSHTDSPSSSVFRDLIEETVRHMVSPNIDIDVKSLLAQNAKSENIFSNGKDITAKTDTTPLISESSEVDEGLGSFSGHAILSDTLPVLHTCESGSDNYESSAVEAETSSLFSPLYDKNLSAADSGLKDSVVFSSSDASVNSSILSPGCDKSLHEEPFMHNENRFKETILQNPLEQDDISQGSDLTLSDRSDYKHHFVDPANGVFKETAGPNHSKHKTEESNIGFPSRSFIGHEEVVKDAVNNSTDCDSENHMTTFPHKGAGDSAVPQIGDPGKGGSFRQHTTDHSSVRLCDKEKHSVSPLTDLSSLEMQATTCVNNSNSPTVLKVGDQGEPLLVRVKKASEVSITECNDSAHISFEKLHGLEIGATGQGDDVEVDAAGLLLKPSDADLTNDCADGLVDVYNNATTDSLNIENVDLSLDEEPWLAVGPENDGSDLENSKEPLKQPDFFTTFSLNGLTQELASALTSLDGSTTSFLNEDTDDDLDS